jgi:hypothetical protein
MCLRCRDDHAYSLKHNNCRDQPLKARQYREYATGQGIPMTLFHMSYALLWGLALVLVLASVILLYLLAQLEARIGRATTAGYGINLIGSELSIALAKDALSGVVPDTRAFRNKLHVVLALTPGCGTCRRLINELKAEPHREIAGIPLMLLCMGGFEQCKAAVADLRLTTVCVLDVRDDATADLWLAGFPAALVVDEAGIVIDVRHPLTIKGVVAAVENSKVSRRYRASHHGDAVPGGAPGS